MQHPILYEINTRCWLNELSSQHSSRITLGEIPDVHFLQWQQLGITHIWLMGVWSTGRKGHQQAIKSAPHRQQYDEALRDWSEKDVGGSPYAIADFKVSRTLGGESGLKKFRRKLQKHQINLLLDFVPNHLGLDHPWVSDHPERFVQCDTPDAGSFIGGSSAHPVRLCHGRDPYFDPWKDTAQLDYRRTDTRTAMIDELKAIAGRCDGVRCDMAVLLLNDVFHETWRNHPNRADTRARRILARRHSPSTANEQGVPVPRRSLLGSRTTAHPTGF